MSRVPDVVEVYKNKHRVLSSIPENAKLLDCVIVEDVVECWVNEIEDEMRTVIRDNAERLVDRDGDPDSDALVEVLAKHSDEIEMRRRSWN